MADTVNEDGFRFGMSATGRDTAAATTTRPRDEEYNPLNNWPLFGHLHTVHPNPVISPYSWHHVDRVPPGPAPPNLGYTYNPLSSAPEMYSYINHLSSNEELPPEEIQAILGQSLGVSVDALPRAKDCVSDSSFRCNKTAIGSERKSAEASRAHRLKIEREEFINAIPDKPYGPFMYSRLLESPSTFEEQSATLSSSSSSLRPTYSEVAKLSKEKKVVNSRTASPKDDIENFQKKMSPHDNLIKSPSHKPRRVNSNHKKQKNLSASIMSHSVPVVSPDSKYGLDKFEQTDIKKEDCSQGVNNASLYGFSDGSIPVSVRKESSGSVSSSFSGVEDVPIVSANSRTSPAATSQPKLAPRSCPLNAGETSVPLNSPKKKDNKKEKSNEARKTLQNKKAAKSKQQQQQQHASGAEKLANSSPILNNGIPAPPNAKTHYGTHRQSSGYINNDLREFKKCTNAATNPTMASGYRDTNYKNNDIDDCCNSSNASCSSTTSNNNSGGGRGGGGGGSSNSGFYKNVSTSSQMSGMSNKMKNQDRGSNHRHHSRFLFGIERATLDDYGKVVKSKLRWLIHQLWMMTVTSVVLVLAVVTGLVHLMILVGSKVWNVFVSRIWKKYSRAWKWKKGDDKTSRKIGLDENIKLPSTGEEAMQRLLSCRGKDPYSILGLKADSTDEDIKKYYKKQAILVHPDKNSQTGAEEAFKILRHAFEMIGEPEKRVKYDAQMQQSDQAMREFADLLNKLKERFKQEANMMKCDQCGGKHQRIPVDKPWYSARYCDKCNINHPAKEGDVWAQTSMLGFLWHYYACMDGHVYDITEWVSCRKGLFKHLKSNSHQVFYRIETDTDRGGSHRTGEADLDGFINQLLNQARQSDPSNSTSSTSSHNNNSSKNNHNTWSHQQSTQTGAAAAGTAAGATSASKMGKRKRKKKRH